MAKKVSPIPKGCHALTPILVVQGAVKAIEFYKMTLGGER